MAYKTIHDLTAVAAAAAADEIELWRAANADTRKITRTDFLGGLDTEVADARTRIPYALGSPPTALGDTIEYLAGGAANVKAYGAVGDGVTDDSTAIQAALDAHDLIYFPPGDYVLQSSLEVPDGKTIYALGGATLHPTFASSGGISALVVQGSNVTIRNLSIVGTSSFDNGILIDLDAGDLSNIRIDQCAFSELKDAIQIKAITIAGRTLSDLWITDNRFTEIEEKIVDMVVSHGAFGEVYSMEDIHIERNYMADCGEDSSKPGGGEGGGFTGVIYIGGLTSVKHFFLRDNTCLRVSPQLFAMSNGTFPFNPRTHFVVTGNIVDQEGSAVICNMSYTFSDIENLIFSDNSCHYVDYEHCFMRNCRNFKVSNSHFSRGNVGVAAMELAGIADPTPLGERCFGTIDGCTFDDMECPSSVNDGNKAIDVKGDGAEVTITNCRFTRRTGTKGQVGITSAYYSVAANQNARYAIAYDTVNYSWVQRTGNEYSLHSASGGDPLIRRPVHLYEDGTLMTAGTIDSLAAGQWGFGDSDSLGYYTIYVRTGDGAAPTSLEISAGLVRIGINITGCQFERVGTAINVTSGGSASYPAHGKVVNCTFKRCTVGASFSASLDSLVMGCSFDSCRTDVRLSGSALGFRALHNTHSNTNPTDVTTSNLFGAYVIDAGSGYSLWSIIGCTFRNVRRIHQLSSGALAPRQRMVIFRDNDVDTGVSTGAPSGAGVITMITNAQKVLAQATGAPTGGDDWTLGDTVLNSEPSPGEAFGWVGTADTDYSAVLPVQATAHFRENAGSPSGVLTPLFKGEEVFDTTSNVWWKSNGTGSAQWKQISN